MRAELRRIRALLTVTSVLAWTTVASAQTGPVTAENGFQPNRDYLALQPFEAIDTASGNLVLTFTDLELPANGGRALTFNRVFNNTPMFQEPQWRFGISGVPLQVVQPNIPASAQILNTIISERSWAPKLKMPDALNNDTE